MTREELRVQHLSDQTASMRRECIEELSDVDDGLAHRILTQTMTKEEAKRVAIITISLIGEFKFQQHLSEKEHNGQ